MFSVCLSVHQGADPGLGPRFLPSLWSFLGWRGGGGAPSPVIGSVKSPVPGPVGGGVPWFYLNLNCLRRLRSRFRPVLWRHHPNFYKFRACSSGSRSTLVLPEESSHGPYLDYIANIHWYDRISTWFVNAYGQCFSGDTSVNALSLMTQKKLFILDTGRTDKPVRCHRLNLKKHNRCHHFLIISRFFIPTIQRSLQGIINSSTAHFMFKTKNMMYTFERFMSANLH